MKLGIAEIKSVIGKLLEFVIEEKVDDFEFAGEILAFAAPIQVAGKVENLGNRIFRVEGMITAVIEVPCYRCLSKTQAKLAIDFSQDYSDMPEDEEIAAFTGDDIDLLPQVLNEIILNLPGQILCHPDCQGLCLHCGTNLNIKECACDKSKVDPRLEVLKKLLKSH